VFKDRAVARLLPPEAAAAEDVAREIGVGAGTLERWRSEALSGPARERAWTAVARLDAVVATAGMDEAGKSGWCRANGVFPQQLAAWRQSATQALAAPEEARASPQQTRQDRRRIKELERELRRKDKALAETAALLVLSKKVAAIFNRDRGDPGQPTSSAGTTSTIVTAGSATSPPSSAMPAPIAPSSLLGMCSTPTPASGTLPAGQATPATGRPSTPSPSTRSATRWSQSCRALPT
jgi:hypothetical protein